MISIIIPNLHSPLIGEVIAALEGQTARASIDQIIVVGMDRHGLVPAGVRFIATPRPVSVTRARNLGVQAAQSELVAFIDADCIAEPECVERLLARHSQGYTAVGGAMQIEPRPYWTMCDNILTFTQALAVAPAGVRNYLPGFTLSVSRQAVLDAGGFDESFAGSGGGDDLEFCWRLLRRGARLFFEPRARVYHRPARSSFAAMWRHLHHYGRAYSAIVGQHADVMPSRLSPRLRPLGGLVIAGAPLLALASVLQMYLVLPGLRAHWRALPGLAAGKIAWYWGVAETLMRASAEARQTTASSHG